MKKALLNLQSLSELRDWLLGNNCRDVCMESTGKYWVPVFNILEQDIRVVVVNPKWVRAIKGNKDDVKNSKWIADLFCFGLVRNSFIPEKPVRILREFTSCRAKLVAMMSSEKNRFQNCLTVCNIALDSVVSDIFGVSASKIIKYLLTDESPQPSACVGFLHKSMKGKANAVVESIEGFMLTDAQKWHMLKILEHMEHLSKAIAELDEKINELVAPYEPAIKLLCTIAGVKREAAITIISEIGTDMPQFGSSKRLCCWAGLTPGNNESAGKKKSVRITRAGVYIKPMLVQVAHVAVKCTTEPYYKLKYERIMRRRGKKRAIIAIARMILTAIYHMLSTGAFFNPADLGKIDISPQEQAKKLQDDINRAVKLLKEQRLLPENYCA